MTGRDAPMRLLTALFLVLGLPSTGYGYAGPGGVITAIGAFLALVAAIVAALAGFVWYPLKRLMGWIRSRGVESERVSAKPPDGLRRE